MKFFTYRAGSEGLSIAALRFVHANSHVGIAGEIEILQEHGVGTRRNLQFHGGCSDFHVRLLRKAGHVAFQNHLLVAHFRHCSLSLRYQCRHNAQREKSISTRR
nr:hypothetical protein Iba_scaffold15939CG0010 [Ipomoea batatas]